MSRNNWWGRAEEGERGAFSYDGGVSHHGEELCIVDDPVLVLVGLLDDGVDLLLRHGLPKEAQHGGQLVAVDVAVPVLRGGWAHRKRINYCLEEASLFGRIARSTGGGW